MGKKKKDKTFKNLPELNDDNITLEERIEYAIKNKLLISFSYTNKEGTQSERLVMPNIITKFKGSNCVRGYCNTEKKIDHLPCQELKTLKFYLSKI